MRAGSMIGQYRVLGKIGEGSMGVVFVAEHVLIGRKAAIKVLKPEISKHARMVERFFNEARATAAIQDPGIAQLFDVGTTNEQSAYIVMELLDGEPLDQRLNRVGALAPRDALRIVRQAASTLAVVHSAGVIHRDLKPANLFSVADSTAPGGERIKILDFGIAKLGPDLNEGEQTLAGAIVGTPHYMSPEQCRGIAIDQRADIYSLGCVLFRLLTGQPPFPLEGAAPVITAHVMEPAPRPSRIAPQLPAAVDDLVLRCLAKSPAERFPSMVELGVGCDQVLATLPDLPAAPPVPPTTEASTVRLDGDPTTPRGNGELQEASAPRTWIGAAIAIGTVLASLAAVAVVRSGTDDRAVEPARRAVPARTDVAPPIDVPAMGSARELTPAEPAIAKPAAAPPVAKPAPKPPTPKRPAAKPAVPSPRAKPGSNEPRDDLYDDRN